MKKKFEMNKAQMQDAVDMLERRLEKELRPYENTPEDATRHEVLWTILNLLDQTIAKLP
jgi:hypothetical protein